MVSTSAIGFHQQAKILKLNTLHQDKFPTFKILDPTLITITNDQIMEHLDEFPQDNDYRIMSTIRVYTSPIGELSSPNIKSEEKE